MVKTNLLGDETSPYLLQHKDNPVHWRPWGPAALAEAKAENKPILLSIGYAACHWCHVMAHESFADKEVAEVMNALFVNIKVDREERPDIDAIYMQALHHLGEQGGWPLTMFLAPDGAPFWGGTYFPRTPRYGRPGFIDVLREVDRIFRLEPDKIELNREALMLRLNESARASSRSALSREVLDQAALKLLTVVDPLRGGTQGAPKFPQVPFLELLWRAGGRIADDRFRQSVEHSVAQMAQGGIYDHLGGGFARYSVDENWLVPHFEKMLYDNAMLIGLMSLVWRKNHAPLLEVRVRETVGFLMRELRDEGGAFYSSLDADSEGEEGKYYVWHPVDLAILLEEDYAFFASHYDVTSIGNWEGKTILNRSRSLELEDEETEEKLAALREKLLVTRETRVRPGLDDKVLADWNGLAIAALAQAGFVFDEAEWIKAARKAFDFVVKTMSEGPRLLHSYRAGRAAQRGMLSDYANMMRAGLLLYERQGDDELLGKVTDWYKVLERHFLYRDGSYFMTAADADDLILRPRSGGDDATPNGNAVMAEVAIRLWHLTGETAYRDRAEAILQAFAGQALSQLFGFATLFNSFDLALNAVELIVMEPEPETSRGSSLLGVQREIANPNILARRLEDRAELPPHHPATGKTSVGGKAAAYVCTEKGCSLPVSDVASLRSMLSGV